VDDVKFCLEHYEGMTKVDVIHKKTFFGYLPCKMKLNGTTKLVFPVGEFTTTVNFNELRYAIECGVVEVTKVHYLIWANPMKSIFVDYIYNNYCARKATKSVLDNLIYKLKMNSLYGRFAMRMKMTTTYWQQFPVNYVTKLRSEGKFCEIKLFSAMRADCFIITENEKSKNSYFSIPTFSSYITSQARVNLLKSLTENENNKVCYCDTDSIFLLHNFIGNCSDSLGDWKLEEKIVTEIRGLKNYTYKDEKGKTHDVIKGVSRGSEKKGTSKEGFPIYETKKYFKTKDSLRRNKGAGESYTMVKTISGNYDKREVLNDGTTLPLFCVKGKPINAMTFIRPKSDAIRKRREKAFRYEPETLYEAILLFFVNGGKVYTKDLIDNVTGRSKKELNSYRGLHDKDGVHMDVFCELVPEHFYTDRIIDVFQDVLLAFHRRVDMQKYLEDKKELNKQDYIFTETEFDYDTPF